MKRSATPCQQTATRAASSRYQASYRRSSTYARMKYGRSRRTARSASTAVNYASARHSRASLSPYGRQRRMAHRTCITADKRLGWWTYDPASMCKLCPCTCVSYVSGLYTGRGYGACALLGERRSGIITAPPVTKPGRSIGRDEMAIPARESAVWRMKQEGEKDPEAFWGRAAEALPWFRRWDKVLHWQPPTFNWYLGGQTNLAYN